MKNIKICRFITSTSPKPRIGIVNNEQLWTLKQLLPSELYKTEMEQWNVEQMIPSWETLYPNFVPSHEGVPLSNVQVVSPLSNYGREVFCIGKNYGDHVKEMAGSRTMNSLTVAQGASPIIFTKTRTSIPLHPVIVSSESLTKQLDYEAEFAVIVGKKVRAVSEESAWDCVFGYSLLNDVTARDLQKRHGQWILGKGADTFCPIGPFIVPVSSLPNPQAINEWTITCLVNGELRQKGSVNQMIHSIPKQLEVISTSITLFPGDVLATGTPSGVGAGFQPEKFLKNGDEIKIECPQIGTLLQTVVITSNLRPAKL
jgi:2-keto-4-pentenoate hydratase/2-oxohepta-3-ene-1,7-dioic acid hydratase in catechol pathway